VFLVDRREEALGVDHVAVDPSSAVEVVHIDLAIDQYRGAFTPGLVTGLDARRQTASTAKVPVE
jgi:hypothetical protein